MGASGVLLTGDTTTYANDIDTPSSCTGYGNDGPDAIYMLDLTAGRTLTATVTATWDISLSLVQPCTLSPTCVAGVDASGGDEVLTRTITAPGVYYLAVDSYLPTVYGTYSLTVRVQ